MKKFGCTHIALGGPREREQAVFDTMLHEVRDCMRGRRVTPKAQKPLSWMEGKGKNWCMMWLRYTFTGRAPSLTALKEELTHSLRLPFLRAARANGLLHTGLTQYALSVRRIGKSELAITVRYYRSANHQDALLDADRQLLAEIEAHADRQLLADKTKTVPLPNAEYTAALARFTEELQDLRFKL